jgi:hypothetical protein
MTEYFYDRWTNGKDKTYKCYCEFCGSVDLKNPYTDESDHRQITRFTCNTCGKYPYIHSNFIYHMDITGCKRYD